MCGIVGAVAAPKNPRNIVPVLIEGLKKLEYRGYDSAGLAIAQDHQINRVRAVGRVAELEAQSQTLSARVGIAHTRWATHGGVTTDNAHPHLSDQDGLSICVVHNGIIENHEPLRQMLRDDGYVFLSETDTEVIAHLIDSLYEAKVRLICSAADVPERLYLEGTGAFLDGLVQAGFGDAVTDADVHGWILEANGTGRRIALQIIRI